MITWGIASDASVDLERYQEQYGVSFPILFDDGQAVFNQYWYEMAFPTAAYPMQVLVGRDGRVRYTSRRFEREELVGAIEAALAE